MNNIKLSEEYEYIDKILNSNDADELVIELIKKYSHKGVIQCQALINNISNIASIMVGTLDNKISKQWNSLLAATHFVSDNSKKKVIKNTGDFISLLFLLEELYPDINTIGESHKYILRLIKDNMYSKIFDFNSEKDIEWSKMFNHYDYLSKIRDYNIDN